MSKRRPRRIKTLRQLHECALDRRSVYCRSYIGGMQRPAAFVINWQAMRVMRLLDAGLYVYRPEKPKKGKEIKV